MNIKRKFFNLVEITLAIGVIAYGMTSVMSLTIIASKQTRDASTETYVSQVVESLYAFMEVRSRKSATFNTSLIPLAQFADGTVSDPDFFNNQKVTAEIQRRFGIQYARLQSYYPLKYACDRNNYMNPVTNNTVDNVKYYMEYIGDQNGSPKPNGLDAGILNYPAVWVCRVIQNEGTPEETVAFSCFVRMWRQCGSCGNETDFEGSFVFRVPTLMGTDVAFITQDHGAHVVNSDNGSESWFAWNYNDKGGEAKTTQKKFRTGEMMGCASSGIQFSSDVEFQSFSRMNIEVSWPIDVDPAYRQKRIFYKEFCK